METKPRRGERYIVEEPIDATILTHWRAPFTGGSEKTLPRGLEFVVAYDPPEQATAVSCDPADPRAWESLLVDEPDILADKYAGYSLTIRFEDLRTRCSRLA